MKGTDTSPALLRAFRFSGFAVAYLIRHLLGCGSLRRASMTLYVIHGAAMAFLSRLLGSCRWYLRTMSAPARACLSVSHSRSASALPNLLSYLLKPQSSSW